MEMTNGNEGILQVIQKPEAEDQIEVSQITQRRILGVALAEGNMAKTALGLVHILLAPVDAKHVKAEGLEETREIAQTTTDVNNGTKAQRLFQFQEKARDGFAPRDVQGVVML